MKKLYIAALASVSPLALSAPALAQEAVVAAEAGEVADADTTRRYDVVVVTATKQGAQGLIEVPLAIQAFSGEQLKQRGIQETTDLITAIPGASAGEQVGSVIKTFSLRGVGAAGGIGDSPIGYYVDDVPFAIPNSPLAPPLRFIDIERVEVLRGPQGTLYGQGSAGGTIIYHTRQPDLDKVTARGEASIATMEDASDPNYSVSGAVSVPIVKGKLALRVSGGYDERAGYIDVYSADSTGPLLEADANDISNRDLRAVLLWQPTDALTVTAQAAYWEPKQGYTQSINSLEPPQQWFSGTTEGYEKGAFDLYSLSAEYDFGNAVLTSSTSLLNADFEYLVGQSFGPLGVGSLFNGYDAKSFAQEIQLRSGGDGPFNWLVGGFYQDAEALFSFDAAVTALTINGFNDTKTENYSVFGEVSYDLFGGKLVPLAGVRYFKDNRTFNADSLLTGTGSGEANPDKVTWRANLSYFPTENLTAFATVSTGFRSGITQTPFQASLLGLSGIPADIALEPDSLTNYEAGVKASLAGGDVEVGLNVYRIDFEDLQFALTPFGVSAFANVGEARTTGVDAELRWRTPVDGLNLGAVANWNDSEFGNVVPGVTASLPNVASGERLSSTADYNYRIDADFERSITADLNLFWNASAARTGSRVMYDGYLVPDYSLYNASIGVRNDRWELALFGENLADERGPSFVRNSLLFAGPYPRTIGVRLRANLE